MMPEHVDLTDVSDEALWEELARRHQSVLLVTLDKLAQGDRMLDACEVNYHGGQFTAIGMAAHAQDWILRRMPEVDEGDGL